MCGKMFVSSYFWNVKSVVREALKYEGPALVRCFIDKEEDVVPMLLANQKMSGMWPYEKN